jgi:hypothetical protein
MTFVPQAMINRIKRLMPKPETMANNRWLKWLGPSLLHPRLWHLSRLGGGLQGIRRKGGRAKQAYCVDRQIGGI